MLGSTGGGVRGGQGCVCIRHFFCAGQFHAFPCCGNRILKKQAERAVCDPALVGGCFPQVE